MRCDLCTSGDLWRPGNGVIVGLTRTSSRSGLCSVGRAIANLALSKESGVQYVRSSLARLGSHPTIPFVASSCTDHVSFPCITSRSYYGNREIIDLAGAPPS